MHLLANYVRCCDPSKCYGLTGGASARTASYGLNILKNEVLANFALCCDFLCGDGVIFRRCLEEIILQPGVRLRK